MASMPLYWQPPPATEVPQYSSSGNYTENYTIGPFIAVFVVVIVLCILASVIGRICSGKTFLGYGDYDMERWAESRCGSCIDGHIIPHRPSQSPPPPPPPPPRQHLHHTSSGVSAESEEHVADLDETDGEKQDSFVQEQTPSSAHP